jgi:hypothetical protein
MDEESRGAFGTFGQVVTERTKRPRSDNHEDDHPVQELGNDTVSSGTDRLRGALPSFVLTIRVMPIADERLY